MATWTVLSANQMGLNNWAERNVIDRPLLLTARLACSAYNSCWLCTLLNQVHLYWLRLLLGLSSLMNFTKWRKLNITFIIIIVKCSPILFTQLGETVLPLNSYYYWWRLWWIMHPLFVIEIKCFPYVKIFKYTTLYYV